MAITTTTIQAIHCNWGNSEYTEPSHYDETLARVGYYEGGTETEEYCANIQFPVDSLKHITPLKVQLQVYLDATDTTIPEIPVCVDNHTDFDFDISIDGKVTTYPRNYVSGYIGETAGWYTIDIDATRMFVGGSNFSQLFTDDFYRFGMASGNTIALELTPTDVYSNDWGTGYYREFRTQSYGDGSYAPKLIITHNDIQPQGVLGIRSDSIYNFMKLYNPLDITNNALRVVKDGSVCCFNSKTPATTSEPLQLRYAKGGNVYQALRGIPLSYTDSYVTLDAYDIDESWSTSEENFNSNHSANVRVLDSTIPNCTGLIAIKKYSQLTDSRGIALYVHEVGGSWEKVSDERQVDSGDLERMLIFKASFSKRDIDKYFIGMVNESSWNSSSYFIDIRCAFQEQTRDFLV